MNLLPLTLIFLLIFALLGTARDQEYKATELTNALFASSAIHNQSLVAKQFKDRADALHAALNPNHGTAPGKKKFKALAIASLKKKEGEDPKTDATLFLFKRLLTALYSKQQFFKEAFEKGGSLDEFMKLLHDGAIRFGDLHSMKRTEDLGNIKMPTPAFKTALYKMTIGNVSTKNDKKSAQEEYVPLSERADMTNHPKLVYLYRASEELLYALFPKPETVHDVLRFRKAAEAQLKACDEDKRPALMQTLNSEMRNLFEKELPKEVPPQFVDFAVSGSE